MRRGQLRSHEAFGLLMRKLCEGKRGKEKRKKIVCGPLTLCRESLEGACRWLSKVMYRLGKVFSSMSVIVMVMWMDVYMSNSSPRIFLPGPKLTLLFYPLFFLPYNYSECESGEEKDLE